MVKYPSINMRIFPLNVDRVRSLGDLKSYLKDKGDAYHQNVDNLNRIESHYLIENSVVLIREFSNRYDIRIVSSGEGSLNRVKISIDKILNGY